MLSRKNSIYTNSNFKKRFNNEVTKNYNLVVITDNLNNAWVEMCLVDLAVKCHYIKIHIC